MPKITCTNATIQCGDSEPMAVCNLIIIDNEPERPCVPDCNCSVEFTAEWTYYNPYVGIAIAAIDSGFDAVQVDAIGYWGERLSSVTTSELTPDGIELAARLAARAANTEPKWNGER